MWVLIGGDDGNDNGDNGGNEGNDGSGIEAWNSTKVYLSGDKVNSNGVIYQAKWWTLGETPGSSSVWVIIH